MIKAIIDTNCLLASIPPRSDYYWLYEAFERGEYKWILSTEILLEYEEKLQEYYSEKTARLVLSILCASPNSVFIEPYFQWKLMDNDPDDNKFVDLAVFSWGSYLVSQDKDFDVLKTIDFPTVHVVSLSEFKEILRNAPE